MALPCRLTHFQWQILIRSIWIFGLEARSIELVCYILLLISYLNVFWILIKDRSVWLLISSIVWLNILIGFIIWRSGYIVRSNNIISLLFSCYSFLSLWKFRAKKANALIRIICFFFYRRNTVIVIDVLIITCSKLIFFQYLIEFSSNHH